MTWHSVQVASEEESLSSSLLTFCTEKTRFHRGNSWKTRAGNLITLVALKLWGHVMWVQILNKCVVPDCPSEVKIETNSGQFTTAEAYLRLNSVNLSPFWAKLG